MLKKERLLKLTEIVNQEGIITVTDIVKQLNVSDMTIRRDLDELDKAGKILRIHGGAQSISYALDQELSHTEKQEVQKEEKNAIAKLAASYVEDGDTIFLGPGTTIELLAGYLGDKKIRIITNSYPVFENLRQYDSADIILVGGDYRKNTRAFFGPIANETLKRLKFTKCFISSNGIHNEAISTYNMAEGETQNIALNNSRTKYLLVDNKKFNRDDFYIFYNLHDIDYLVTDDHVSPDLIAHYSQYVTLQQAQTTLGDDL
jgi:DeoR family transcriptional regulator, lactose phosphotransferase system repressor